MKQSVTFCKNIFLVLLSVSFLAISCSKKDDAPSVPAAPFAGNYQVEDESDPYTLKIVSKGDNKLQITNFGGFLNVPINAVADGSHLTIPSQTFKNPNGNTLTIVGTGALKTKTSNNDQIVIDYSLSGYTNFTGVIEGLRK